MCVCVFWQVIGEKVAHAYACVCVFWQVIGENVAHAYACVCVFRQVIGEKVVDAHGARILGDSTRQNGFAEKVVRRRQLEDERQQGEH